MLHVLIDCTADIVADILFRTHQDIRARAWTTFKSAKKETTGAKNVFPEGGYLQRGEEQA